jgi:hypothetical protein
MDLTKLSFWRGTAIFPSAIKASPAKAQADARNLLKKN